MEADADEDVDHAAGKSDSINSVKTRQFQEITGNLSHHYIFPDSLINSNYFFHYSPVHSPNS